MYEVFNPSPISNDPSLDKIRKRADRILNQIKESEWENQNAFSYLKTIIDLPGFGLPDVFCETKQGCAIWRNRKLGHLQTHSVKIVDECVLTKCMDTECCGFVYITIGFNTNECKCSDQIMNLSRHVIIDREKNLIKSRGDSIEMCIAILSIFTSVGVCRVDPEKAKKMQADDKAIILAKTSGEDYQRMLQSLADNINRLQ